jgi:NAD+ synthase
LTDGIFRQPGPLRPFSKSVLDLERQETAASIEAFVRQTVLRSLRRRGAVVGMSGGIDSSVAAALCARALGPERVLGLFMPDRESSEDSLRLGRAMAETLGIRTETIEISATLEAMGCYESRGEAIRRVFPDFGDDWRFKLTLPEISERARYNIFSLVVHTPSGEVRRSHLPPDSYRQLVAAGNMKQRVRKLTEYYHAERLDYAVIGTPNRLEYDQGFFVKYGDGAADLKPIAHLYKTQVYALAEALGVPDEIRRRPPTTDTYSLAQTQEEFYFALPYDKMDLCLWAHNHGVTASAVAPVVDLSPTQVELVFRDIESKRRATRSLHLAPALVERVLEVEAGPIADERPGTI